MFDVAEIHENVSIFSSISTVTFPIMYTSFTFCGHFVGCGCLVFWQLKAGALMNKKHIFFVGWSTNGSSYCLICCWEKIQGQFYTQNFIFVFIFCQLSG